jgi:hypothetical protein
MPLSRAAFQIRMPDGTKIRTKNVARAVKEVKGGTRVFAGRISTHSKIGLEDRNAELKTHTRALPSLAPVAPQIEMPAAAKDTQRETKMDGKAARKFPRPMKHIWPNFMRTRGLLSIGWPGKKARRRNIWAESTT